MIRMLNEKIKKMDTLDITLVKLSSLFFGILLAKIFPSLLGISYAALVLLIVICGIKPFYKFWFKK